MRRHDDGGERWPETSAHLLAMQRIATQEEIEAANLALPNGIPIAREYEVRRYCTRRHCWITEIVYVLR